MGARRARFEKVFVSRGTIKKTLDCLERCLWSFLGEALDYLLSSKQGVSWSAHCTNWTLMHLE